MQNRIKWFYSEKPITQFYDKNTKKITNPKKYIDAFFRLHYLTKELKKYEIKYSIKYDYIIKMRIDQILDTQIIIPQKDESEKIYWNRMDNFFYGTSEIMKYICLNFIDKVGSYDNNEITENGDFRLTIEPQFRKFIETIKCEEKKINLTAGIKLIKENLCITLPNWKIEENNRKIQEKTFEEYYKPEKLKKSFYPIYSNEFPYIWVYYLHQY